MPRNNQRRRSYPPHLQKPRLNPNEPAQREVSPRHYFPGLHPDDPSRDELQVPWQSKDSRDDANTAQGLPMDEVWGDYSLTSPWARPRNAEDFFAHSGTKSLSGLNLGKSVTIVQFKVPLHHEGRLLYVAGQSVTAADLVARNLGFDLDWELKLNSSKLPKIGRFGGGFSSLENPRLVIVNIPQDTIIELAVTAPIAGGARDIQAYLKGWIAPIVRGMGRVSAGTMKP